jgi:hypothetical protein
MTPAPLPGLRQHLLARTARPHRELTHLVPAGRRHVLLLLARLEQILDLFEFEVCSAHAAAWSSGVRRMVLGGTLCYGGKGGLESRLLLVAEEVYDAGLTHGLVVTGGLLNLSIVISHLTLLLELINESHILVLLRAVDPVHPPILDLDLPLLLPGHLSHLVGLPVGILVLALLATATVEAAGRFVVDLLVVEIQHFTSRFALNGAHQVLELTEFLVDFSCQRTLLIFLGRPLLLETVYGCHEVEDATQDVAFLLAWPLSASSVRSAAESLLVTVIRPHGFQNLQLDLQLPEHIILDLAVFSAAVLLLSMYFIVLVRDVVEADVECLAEAGVDVSERV